MPRKKQDELTGLHEFRARLAQSKLLILQGVEALKKQQFDDALALFQKSTEQTPDLSNQLLLLGTGVGGQERTSTCEGSL